jgi:hypothetical protein
MDKTPTRYIPASIRILQQTVKCGNKRYYDKTIYLFFPVTARGENMVAFTKEDYEIANKKVDYILAQERAAQEHSLQSWCGRDKIPEPIRELLDVYVEITGQRPVKKQLMDWMCSGQEWLELGIIDIDLRNAYARSKDGQGFTVARPGSLTAVAGMFAGERRKKPSTSRIVISAPPVRKNEFVEIDLDKQFKKETV